MFKRIILSSVFLLIFSGLALTKGKPKPEPTALDCTVFISSPEGQIQCVKVGNKPKVTNLFEDMDGGCPAGC